MIHEISGRLRHCTDCGAYFHFSVINDHSKVCTPKPVVPTASSSPHDEPKLEPEPVVPEPVVGAVRPTNDIGQMPQDAIAPSVFAIEPPNTESDRFTAAPVKKTKAKKTE